MTDWLRNRAGWRRMLRRWRRQDTGSVAVIFAVSLIAICGVVSLAVDYGRMIRAQWRLQHNGDAAALAAASTAARYIASQSSQGSSVLATAETRALAAARTYFTKNEDNTFHVQPNVTASVSISGITVTTRVTASSTLPTVFAQLIGSETVEVASDSVASVRLPPYISVTLLIDTSGSMALGASASDQTRLRSATGCAFACHDNAPVNGFPDAFAYAEANGIVLRLHAMRMGILSLLDRIDEVDPGHQFVSTTVYSFDNDLTVNTSATTDTGLVRRNLPVAPAVSGMTDGATHFDAIIGDVMRRVGASGDGRSPDNPVKLLIIATDGAHDPGRYWTTDVAARDQVRPIDTRFCPAAQRDGVKIGIIHTPYLDMSYDWGYVATLGQPSLLGNAGTRADDIPTVLQACAGPLYRRADDTAQIKAAFSSIFGAISEVALTQ